MSFTIFVFCAIAAFFIWIVVSAINEVLYELRINRRCRKIAVKMFHYIWEYSVSYDRRNKTNLEHALDIYDDLVSDIIIKAVDMNIRDILLSDMTTLEQIRNGTDKNKKPKYSHEHIKNVDKWSKDNYRIAGLAYYAFQIILAEIEPCLYKEGDATDGTYCEDCPEKTNQLSRENQAAPQGDELCTTKESNV